MSALRMDTTRFSNMAGTLKTGMTGLHLQRLQKTFLQLKLKDADGKEVVCYKSTHLNY
jgi:hypothetical protein